MKLIVGIIKPFKVDDVKEVVKELGVQGLTVSEEDESGGLDLALHSETAYAHDRA